VGLLLLRLAVGGCAILRGVHCIESGASLIGIACIASGILLVLGFLTPAAGLLVILGAGAAEFARFRNPQDSLAEPSWMKAFGMIVTVAIILLGPGAISIDARLFGRRKIVIPGRRP